jgi:hypothetical protein
MKLTIKATESELEALKTVADKVRVLLPKLTKVKEINKENNIINFSFNPFLGTVTLDINDAFVTDAVDLYGDALLAGLLFGKSMADVTNKSAELGEKWF